MPLQTPPVVVIGPSGAGKSTLVNMMVEKKIAVLHPTITTRAQRSDDDTSHLFVPLDTFNGLKANRHLIGVSQVFGYWYALPELPDTSERIIVILRASFVEEFRSYYPTAIVVEVEAPIKILQERLRGRGDAERANAKELQDEIDRGRMLADYIIDTTNPFADNVELLETVCKTY